MSLRVGTWVEVRSREEILSTLDAEASLQALPFMPEMLQLCGKRFRVYKSAHKTCDTIDFQGARKLGQTVHLDGVRCNGSAHGGCQARCLIFWKEAWLKRVDGPEAPVRTGSLGARADRVTQVTDETVLRSTRPRVNASASSGEDVYRCQATELNRASTVLPWWDMRQYAQDLLSGNVGVGRLTSAFLFFLFTKLIKLGAYRALLWTYDRFQKVVGGVPYPFRYGSLQKTPRETMDLQSGERIQVKTQEEILRTVNSRNRNRGLSFDEEMVEFCGGTYTVLQRVEKIINEKTGKLMKIEGDCIMLDGVTCQSRFKNQRLFCPRSISPYWREIWLRRIDTDAQPKA